MVAPGQCCAAAASTTICGATASACYTALYEDYKFEVIVQKDGHYPQDHDYPPVPREAVLGRLLASVLRAHAGGRPVDGHRASGHRQVHRGCRRLGDRRSSSTTNSRPAKLTWRRRLRRGRWGSTWSVTGRPSPGAHGPAAAASANLSVTSELCRGCLLADVPAVVGSLDIVLGEIDR